MTITAVRHALTRPLTTYEVIKVQESPWYKASRRVITRGDCDLEPGVNYFVETLESQGATTLYSCEGHPKGFYVMFKGPYSLARRIAALGYFHVSIVTNAIHTDPDTWIINLNLLDRVPASKDLRARLLSEASVAWNKEFKV